MKPLCIDLFCGMFGWGRGFVAEGYRVVGFDLVHEPYHGPVPDGCELVLQDVLTLSGAQFRDAACIVASPPCQCYSYMAMPWTRAKKMAVEIRQSPERIAELNALFDCCFRLQREASEAAGHHIPLVVENVKGAQPWVGRAAWHYGSFYLWGDVPALMPFPRGCKPDVFAPLNGHDDPRRGRKNTGGSWFAIGSPGQKELSRNPVTVSMTKDDSRLIDGSKGLDGKSWIRDPSKDPRRNHGTNSSARKAASAQIAKIPEALARHIARCYKP